MDGALGRDEFGHLAHVCSVYCCRFVRKGVNEPPDFVQCLGTRVLEEAGVEVWRVEGLENECLEFARRGRE